MKELGVPFEEELVPFGGNERYRTFGEFSPSGRVPCLVDGARVIWDSIAITEFGLQLSLESAAYAARILALPSEQEWYAAALTEPWREPGHEEDARRFGTVIEDLRGM